MLQHKAGAARAVVAVSLLILLQACTGRSTGLTQPNPSSAPVHAAPSSYDTAGADLAGASAGTALPAVSKPTLYSVYFDLDQDTIKSDSVPVVTGWARYVVANPGSTLALVVEGNTDERGSSAYNLGLGERRAKSVAQALVAQGVSAASISTVSYGEEQPLDPAHNEAAWAKNRRVDIVLR